MSGSTLFPLPVPDPRREENIAAFVRDANCSGERVCVGRDEDGFAICLHPELIVRCPECEDGQAYAPELCQFCDGTGVLTAEFLHRVIRNDFEPLPEEHQPRRRMS